MTALCGKRETAKSRRIQQRRLQAEVCIKEESLELSHFPLLMMKTQCPRCIGNKSLLL